MSDEPIKKTTRTRRSPATPRPGAAKPTTRRRASAAAGASTIKTSAPADVVAAPQEAVTEMTTPDVSAAPEIASVPETATEDQLEKLHAEAEKAVEHLNSLLAAAIRSAEEVLAMAQGRLSAQVAAAQSAAEASASTVPSFVAEQLGIFSAEAEKLTRSATEQVATQIRISEDAFRKMHAVIAERVKTAGEDLADPAFSIENLFTANIEAAEQVVATAGKTISAVMEDRIMAGEAAMADLIARLESAPEPVETAALKSPLEVLAGVERTGAAVLRGTSQGQAKFAAFVARRIGSDLDATSALFACKSLADLREVQTQFVKTAVDEYLTVAAGMLRMSDEIARVPLKAKP